MAFVVVYDACALYGNTVRNLLIRLDPDDRHVLAAAIKAGAQVIVTANLADFPGEYLAQWGIEARGLDDFVLDLIGINDRVVHACVQQIVDERSNPPETFDEVLGQLERAGLIETAAVVHAGRIGWRRRPSTGQGGLHGLATPGRATVAP